MLFSVCSEVNSACHTECLENTIHLCGIIMIVISTIGKILWVSFVRFLLYFTCLPKPSKN